MRKKKMLVLLNTLQHEGARRISQEAGELFRILAEKRIIISNGGKRKAELNLAILAVRHHLNEIKKIIAETDTLIGAPPG